MLEVALAAGSTLVALAATLSIFERWRARRRPHEAAWATAFALILVASASLTAGAGLGWNGVVFRFFYLFGAIVNVPVLALGTVVLLGSLQVRRRATGVVALFSAFAAGVMVSVPFTSPIPADRLVRGSEVLPALPRVLAAVASGVATLIVVAGAVRSAWRARRVDGGRQRAAGNALIAVGVVVTGLSGLANSLLGEMGAFALFLAVGVSVIFVGYLTAAASASLPEASGLEPSAEPVVSPPERSRRHGG